MKRNLSPVAAERKVRSAISYTPEQSPWPCKTESGNLLIQLPLAASNEYGQVVILIVS
ncbi:MAG: hypothetical protein ABSG70_11685 [Terriglobales bacterium]